MAFKMTTKFDLTSDIEKAVKSLDRKAVKVGVLRGENAWLASIHEYGCTIPVTNKMRAYLHRIGVHLKKSTAEIVIPERSFLRAGYDKSKEDVLRTAERALPAFLEGKMTESQYLEMIGAQLRDAIKEYAIELSDPPKQDWPTRDPAKSNPLVMSGDMVGSIDYEIEG